MEEVRVRESTMAPGFLFVEGSRSHRVRSNYVSKELICL